MEFRREGYAPGWSRNAQMQGASSADWAAYNQDQAFLNDWAAQDKAREEQAKANPVQEMPQPFTAPKGEDWSKRFEDGKRAYGPMDDRSEEEAKRRREEATATATARLSQQRNTAQTMWNSRG